ncbi:hypothetical protein BZA05DRAFT_473062 [Tricharina praecox]|uniref:uncharacterized protein n=1 Tax=Tricharina praecox TaxID=43433 RepID=UPI00221EA6F0|nr:uncharacterized protein BZA05DRAFT_473062 [Tricharina praecox]KAI5854468.1 hypothetical protein BZA05DRAFT_473062 [Tricharina praecox]
MSATSKPHILIIGAGISGLCFALQILTHANKFYTVTSRTADPSTGFCIILSPNAIRVLRTLSIDLVAIGAARPLTHTRFHSHTGSLLLSADHVVPGDPESLLTVERGKMVRALLDRLQELGGVVEWDHKLSSICTDESTSTVEAVFSCGRRATGSLLVGADGTWSSVCHSIPQPHAPLSPPWSLPILRLLRSPLLLFRSKEEAWMPQPTRWTALYGITPPLPDHLVTPYGALQLYVRDGKPGAYATYSLGGNRLFWICYESSRPSAAAFSGEDAERTRDEFKSAVYGSEGGFTLGDVMKDSQMMKVRLWHAVFENVRDGRVVLIGDAAHPQTTFLGQGAGRGIEEGAELRRALLRKAWGGEGAGVGVSGFVDGARTRGRDVAEMGWWAGCTVMGDWWWSRKARDWLLRYLAWDERRYKERCARKREEAKAKAKDKSPALATVKPVKRQENWLLDYCVPVETEEDFWLAQKAKLREGEQAKGWCSRCGQVLRVLAYALVFLLGVKFLLVMRVDASIA